MKTSRKQRATSSNLPFFPIPNPNHLLRSFDIPAPIIRPPRVHDSYPFLNPNPHGDRASESQTPPPLDVDPSSTSRSEIITTTTDLTLSELAGGAYGVPTMVVATSDSPANSEILGLQITVNDTLNNMQKPSVSLAINKEVQPSVAINGTLDPLAKLIANPSVTDLGKYDQDVIIEQPISEKHPSQVPDGPLCGDIDAQKAQGKLIIHQLVWCDICKVNCSSKSNFERQIVGKKHQKKLKTSGKEELVSMAMGTSLRMNFKAISCALSAIPSIDNESVQMKLDHVHTYYELLNMPVEALHAFIAEHDRLFTAIEYCNLLKLQVPGREVPDDAKARMADILPI